MTPIEIINAKTDEVVRLRREINDWQVWCVRLASACAVDCTTDETQTVPMQYAELRQRISATAASKEETNRADAAEARATRLASAMRILIERHEDEVNGGAAITGEEWEIASYALPRIDSDA